MGFLWEPIDVYIPAGTSWCKHICTHTRKLASNFFFFLFPAHACPTHVGGLPDEPLLRVEDVLDASDQLQRTAVIRALEDKERMCPVRAR